MGTSHLAVFLPYEVDPNHLHYETVLLTQHVNHNQMDYS